MTRRRYASLFAVAFLFALACKPRVIEQGKLVKIDYTLTVDGAVVDTSTGKGPLSYVQGAKQIIPGLEEQLAGLKVGDQKKVTVAPEKGYGPVRKEAVQVIPLKLFGGDPKKLKEGSMVTGRNGDRTLQARVLKISKKDVTLDFNHPLAGKTLNFDVTVVGVESAPAAPPAQPAPPSKAS